MRIGIIGAGSIGSAIAQALANAGIKATIANSRGAESLAGVVKKTGPHITAGSVEEAAQADVVFLAVNWSKIPAAVARINDWQGRIVVDANNPIEAPTFKGVDLGQQSSSEVIAGLLPGARVVKAFNHLQPGLLTANPKAQGGRRVLFVAGNDTDAKNTVKNIIRQLGFADIDLGNLNQGGRQFQFPGGALAAQHLVRIDE